MRNAFWSLGVLGLLLALISLRAEEKFAKPPAADKGPEWTKLFNGKNLDDWKVSVYGGDGEVSVQDGLLILDMGEPLTGVSYKDAKKLLKTNYEISLEAKRLKGSDFFCGLTFPVREKEHCSFIVGGWGGGLTGISSLDGYDASENETTGFKEFKTDKWYKIRIVVTDDRIHCWIDDEKMVDVDIKDRKLSTRSEVTLSEPFGICNFQTKAAIKDVMIRPLGEEKEGTKKPGLLSPEKK